MYFAKTRNRGKVSLEVSERDKDIVEKLCSLYPESHMRIRTRSTNFSDNYTSYSFVNGMISFRTWLIDSGYPKKDKTILASTPTIEYSEIDFWRGVIDGDGSLGYTKDNVPFLSLITKSENLKEQYLKFLDSKMGIKKSIKRNSRDGVYNICIFSEAAMDLSKLLYIYKTPELYIDRKYRSAEKIQNWIRTKPERPWRSSYKTRIIF